MEVKILKYPTDEDWLLCRQITVSTVGKTTTKIPDLKWKEELLGAEHSPIRTINFVIKMIDIPYWVSVHLVRHKIGVEHFVSTQRTDRTGIDRNKLPQDNLVTHTMYINAQELMCMMRTRLCNQASKETQKLMKLIRDEILKTNPEFEKFLVPKCYYRGGLCTELHCCGFNKTYKRSVENE